ncbi:MAG: thiamine phosphate synthase [Pseudomonadota bacterium]|nr:thiamine phosphate synthase [Pseudomonadota bacterium]
MPSRQTLPTIWLMTDQRIGDALWQAIERVPRGGGVMLRHHWGDHALGERVEAACEARGLMLSVAGDVVLARRLGAAMVHNPANEAGDLLISRSIHSRAEALAAHDADLVIVSPLFASASHPGGATLGLEAALDLAELAGVSAIALGGMNRERGETAIRAGFHGWAAIDAFLRS